MPEGGRAPVGEGWRAPGTPGGHAPAAGRESRRGGKVLADRTAIQDKLQHRRPPAPLLRPQRQIGRKVAFGLALVMVGGAAGLVVGLSLRPGMPAPQQQRAETPAPSAAAPSPGATLPGATASNPGQGGLPKAGWGQDMRPAPAAAPAAPSAATTATTNEVEALRRSVAAEQARLESLAQSKTTTEAQAQAQREILARREAALAALPSVTAPLPPTTPRPPRAEPAAGPSAGAAAGAVAPPSGSQRVVLHHRAGSYAAAEAAGAMAAQVREAGFDLNATRAVTATPSQRVVRYFHAEDAPAAARLAGRLGRGWALQDFRSYEPLPAPGLLEVWLPDR